MQVDYLLTTFQDGDHHEPNYHYREIRGRGQIDQTSGTFSLDTEIVFGHSSTWEPALIILICCDNLRFFSANLDAVPAVQSLRDNVTQLEYGGCVNHLREGIITDGSGMVLCSVKAKGNLIVRDGVAYSRTIVYRYDNMINQKGGIKNIMVPYRENIFETVPGRATGISRYDLETGDGSRLQGCTHYPYVFNTGSGLAQPFGLIVENADFSFSTASGVPSAHYEVRTRAVSL